MMTIFLGPSSLIQLFLASPIIPPSQKVGKKTYIHIFYHAPPPPFPQRLVNKIGITGITDRKIKLLNTPGGRRD